MMFLRGGGKTTVVHSLAVLLICSSEWALAGSPVVTGDPVNGEKVYQRCMGCHSLDRNRTGPRHCGLIDRRAGSLEGFEYTAAMKQSGIVWTQANLDVFLAAPLAIVPGTSMGFAGIEERQARLDLIAYIERAGRTPELCGPHDTAAKKSR